MGKVGSKRMVQLDGLRGLAAVAVIVHHYPPVPFYEVPGSLGQAGVWLFFVLSGFLISGVLLGARDEVEAEGLGRVLGTFYARRALRIFPLYYAVLTVSAVTEPKVRAGLPWYALFASNLYIPYFSHGSAPLNHFWSLAVEEQFYLAWPAVLLLTPRRWLPPAVALTALVAPLWRGVAFVLWKDDDLASIVTPGCLDGLAVGALLALARWGGRDVTVGLRVALGLGLVTAAAVLTLGEWPSAWAWREALWPTALSLVFVWLVGRAADGFSSPAGAVLSWRPLVHLGTISYGLYVFHPLVPRLADLALRRPRSPVYHGEVPDPGNFAFVLTASILIASLSWSLFESPINNLKRLLPYEMGREPVAPGCHPAEPVMSPPPCGG